MNTDAQPPPRVQVRLVLVAVAALLAITIGIAVLWPRVERWLAVDRCLDAGGMYDYSSNSCVLELPRKP